MTAGVVTTSVVLYGETTEVVTTKPLDSSAYHLLSSYTLIELKLPAIVRRPSSIVGLYGSGIASSSSTSRAITSNPPLPEVLTVNIDACP
jgi:hypothetical protein